MGGSSVVQDTGLLCNCGSSTTVLETRPIEDGSAVRRRRECLTCGGRFTTHEFELPDLGSSRGRVLRDVRRELSILGARRALIEQAIELLNRSVADSKPEPVDLVDHPQHYNAGPSPIGLELCLRDLMVTEVAFSRSGEPLLNQEAECIDLLERMEFTGLGFAACSAVKYIWRLGLKGSNPAVDARKAVWYLRRHLAGLSVPTVPPPSRDVLEISDLMSTWIVKLEQYAENHQP